MRNRVVGILAALAAALPLLSAGPLAAQELSVVAHPEHAPAELTGKVMKAIFMGEKQRWDDGTKIVVALMKPSTAIGKRIADVVYKMSPDELNRYWVGLVFQGKGSAPKYFDDETALIEYLGKTPGAVGLVNSGTAVGSAKRIPVDGKNAW